MSKLSAKYKVNWQDTFYRAKILLVYVRIIPLILYRIM